jgi:endoglucanase
MMNWIRGIVVVLVLWSSTAWEATLTWNANSEPDLAGYRVYQCGGLPCTRNSGASLLVTLGKATSLNIGTPTEIQYYFVTAYDSTNHESGASNVVVFIPVGSPPPPPTPGGLRIDSPS